MIRFPQPWMLRDGPASRLLEPFARLTGSLVDRVLAEDRAAAERPDTRAALLGVGSIWAGGAGKTPLVEYFGEWVSGAGRRVAVVTRGYGRDDEDSAVLEVETNMDSSRAGDEPLMLKRQHPQWRIVCAAKRKEGVRLLMDSGAKPDLILFDDSLQSRGLICDMHAVALPARQPVGNGKRFPAGPLREPPERLRALPLICFISDGEPARDPERGLNIPFSHDGPRMAMLERRITAIEPMGPGAVLAPEDLRGKRCVLFAGIASPGRFQRAIEHLGGEVAETLWYADHHRYAGGGERKILRALQRHEGALLITTAKDAARISPSSPLRQQARVARTRLVCTAGGTWLLAAVRALPGFSGFHAAPP
ncbi:MAG: Tetraacyldisaccharide 4'-kinase [Myxococcota bacterium]|nr:Tetraacyldisaccharide 4'-kinase [Myxococcota bacterium]